LQQNGGTAAMKTALLTPARRRALMDPSESLKWQRQLMVGSIA
jgi:hypothetical protein